MLDKLERIAKVGDRAAATQMIRVALREDRWDLIGLIGKAMASGGCIAGVLTKAQELQLGKTYWEGDLRLRGVDSLYWLPSGLYVGGGLDLRETAVAALPSDMYVGDYINMSGTLVDKLPENLRLLGGLDLSRTKITSLPEKLHVGGNLYLYRTGITELPPGVHVDGVVYKDP